mgnify:FL=1
MKKICLIIMMICGLFAGCDKLDDGDAGLVNEVLPGNWAFSYELLNDDSGMSFLYDHVIFRTDGSVSITYPDGSIEGTYEAGSVSILIVGTLDGGEMQQMLWRILSFSTRQITLEYIFDINGRSVTAIVTLQKVDSPEN